MTKKILKMLIRIVVISVLLYGSYYMYTRYTGLAIRMIDYQKIYVSLIVHCLIFFFMGIALRFETSLLIAIRNKSARVNFIRMGAAIVFLVALLIMVLSYFNLLITCSLALLTGFFLIESFEYNNK